MHNWADGNFPLIVLISFCSSSYSNNRFHFLHVFRCHQSYLDALYLTEKESENIFEFTMLTDRWVLDFHTIFIIAASFHFLAVLRQVCLLLNFRTSP